jgi:hypothetical protein
MQSRVKLKQSAISRTLGINAAAEAFHRLRPPFHGC